MSDSFGFEKIEREQADQDENITSSSMTENVGEEAPEEDMFRDDIPQKGENLLDDSLGGGDVYSNEATPAEPLISFGSPVAEPSAPSLPPQKSEPVADSTPVSTKTAATSGEGLMGIPGMPALCCWMKTVDPREDIDNTSLKSEMDETSPSNSDSTSPPISAESLAGPFNGDRTNIGDITSDTNKYFDKDSDSSSVISSSDNEYSSSADESDSESANDMSDTCDLASGEPLNAFKPDTTTLQDIDSAGLDYKQLKMDANQENVGVDLLGTVESGELDKVDAVVENDEVECMEKDLSMGAELDPQEAEEDFDNAPVAGNNVSAAAGLSEMDMLDVIERLTKEDNTPVEVCSAESLDNSNQMQAVKDEDYERFIRGEEVYSVDNASPVVSDNDSVGSESGSRDSDISDSDQDNVCSDSDVSGDEANIGNWSPSPLYSGTLSFGNDDEDEDDNEAMEVEETGVLAGYEYEAEGSGAVNQDNELNSLRADVKGLMEEMEAIVNENDESKDKAESQTYVSGVIEEMDKGESERIPAVLKTNEHIVSIMSSGSRERSKTPDNAHVKFQNPTNILFYDPDCPIVEKVSAEVADELIDHDQSYVDQPETELKITEDELDQTSETTEPDDLGAAVIKDLKDVYNNLEAKGEIEANVCGSPPSDNRTIDDMASEFSNEVLEEARRETFESLKNIPDHYGKHELEVTDSLYRKKPRVETDYKPENDFDNQNNEPLEISEEVLASEVRTKNECDPFSNNSMFELGKPGAALLPQKDVDAVSEKEMKSQLLAEKDEFGSKEDDLADNIDEETDDVEIRPKSGRLAELSHEDEDFEGRPDSSRSGSMIIHDEDDSEVQTHVAEAVKQTLAEYNKSSRIKALNEELELEGNVFHSDEDISTSTSSMIIHDDEVTEVPDDMTELDQQTLETNPDIGSSINDKIETNVEHMEHHKVGLDELERKRRYSSDNVIVGDHNLLAHETYDNVSSQLVENEIESEQECVDEQFEVFDNSLNETVIAAETNVLDESVNEILNEKSNEGTEQSINISPNDQSDLNVEDKNIALERKRALQIVSDTIQRVLTEVLDLIYWRDVKKTGVVFGTMLFILLSLTFFTILSVAAYLSLAILTVTLSFRVYKNVMQAVQKTNDGHPFKKLLAVEIALSEDVVQNAAEKIAGNMNNCCKELRRLFLVEDYVDSLKFGLLLWLMTYVGSWFNGMTLVILAVVCIFTLPKVYETYQGPIDQNVNLVRAQLNNIMTQVSSKIPFPKKKAKTQ